MNFQNLKTYYLFIWMVLLFANIPFLMNRPNIAVILKILFRIEKKTINHDFSYRIIEVFTYYFFLGFIGSIFERKSLALIQEKDLKFYLVTFFIYLISSYPGITYRYLIKKKIRNR